MKTIAKKIEINKAPLHLRVKVAIGTKVIINEKANSLLFNFLADLAVMFNGGSSPRKFETPQSSNPSIRTGQFDIDSAPYVCYTTHGTSSWSNPGSSNYRFHQWTISSWDGSTLRVSHANNNAERAYLRLSPTRICIVGGTYAGNYTVNSVTSISTTVTEYEVEGLNADSQVSIDGTVVVASKFRRSNDNTRSTSHSHQDYILTINNIYIGNSNSPVNLHDVFLPGWYDASVFEVGSGFPSYSTPTIAQDQSRIAISQAFTNVSGASQSVRELGLGVFVRDSPPSSNNYRLLQSTGEETSQSGDLAPNGMGLIARDVVSEFQVAPAETITITYEFISTATGKSGIVAGFNEMLYRQLANSSRVARTYFNSDWNSNIDGSIYNWFTGGSSAQFDLYCRGYNSDWNSSYHGIQVGTNEDNIDIDDYYLRNAQAQETRIPHGGADDHLWYYDPLVRGVFTEGNEAYIEIEQLFENKGSTAVTIKEIGLSGGQGRFSPVLLARNVLETSEHVTVAPGEIAKVVYRVAISTGN